MIRPLSILLAFIIDLAFGDPPNRFHPLLLMGRWLNLGRRQAPTENRFWFGAMWTVLGTLLFALPWRFVAGKINPTTGAKTEFWHPLGLRNWSFVTRTKIHPPRPPFFGSTLLFHALALKPIFAYRNLRNAVRDVATALAQDDLGEARRLTSWHLVSRDTSELTADEVAGAAIESLAENITDSVTAPLLAYATGGLPAAWAYRFINTADAMWGYRNEEFELLGKFPARLDDALNWLPARLTGWLLVLASGLTGANATQARHTMLTQHDTVASPNAGWTMSAMAGALEVILSKRGVYNLTGGSRQPEVADMQRAIRVADMTVGLVVMVSVATSLACKRMQD